jgi:O-succinylbenzoic acid--CoA ligase
MAEIRCLVNQSCEISGHHPAVLDRNRVHFFQDLESTVALMAHHLSRRGLGEGDRVAMLMYPSWPAVCTVFALIRIKAIVVPLSPRLPLEGLKSQLAAVQAHTMITEPGLHPEGLDGVDILHAEELSDYVALDRRIIPYHAIGQPAVIVFTSGSSGHPKPAMLTYGNLYYSAHHSNTNLHLSSNHKWLLSIPLYHVGGLGILFRCVEGGGTVVIPTRDVPLSQDVQSYEVTHLSLVPTQLIRMMRAADAKKTARSLHTVLLGGAPISTEHILQALALGFPVHATYGMTETSSQVATHPKYISEDKLHTAGRVLPCNEVIIAEDGEIYVRGLTLFAGYIEDDKTVKPFDAEGWYHTGDIGALDEAGYLTVLGRKDNRFISGGENIYPEEIERILTGRLKVDKAVVVPVADETFGQRPVAFVAFPPGTNAAHLAHQLEEFLPRFKIPVAFHEWPPEAPEDLKFDRIWFQDFINPP